MKSQPKKITTLWEQQLLRTKFGDPKKAIANVLIALRGAPEWHEVLWFDEFHQRTVISGRTPWMRERTVIDWTTQDDVKACEWLQHKGIMVDPKTVAEAVDVVSRDRVFHPVRDYLSGLKWDGTSRIYGWAAKLLGCEPNEYTGIVGARWLISAVARVMQPGCKADCALILEGAQGAGKSSALRVLGEPWFTDEIADLGSKDAAQQLPGVWIIELAELDAMGRPEISRTKAFMSRSTDRYRPSYGRRVVEAPRQCVFAGSVNSNSWARDETGGRRFWPLACGRISLDGLEAVRDQLWAEAVILYQAGDPWWLDDLGLQEMAGEEQRARYQGDAWEPLIEEYLIGRDHVTVGDILGGALNVSKDKWSQPDQNRVARCLISSGWEKYRARDGQKLSWGYRRRG